MKKEEKNIELREYKFYKNTYMASKDGRIFGVNGKEINQTLNYDGYPQVMLSGGIKNKNGNNVRYNVKVHRIVAELFVDKPATTQELEVNHIDLNRKNPYYKNLEWVTHKKNIEHSIKNGSYDNISKGEKNPKSKLKENDIKFIRKLYDDGMMINQIYKKYYKNMVTHNTIEHICKRKTWKHI